MIIESFSFSLEKPLKIIKSNHDVFAGEGTLHWTDKELIKETLPDCRCPTDGRTCPKYHRAVTHLMVCAGYFWCGAGMRRHENARHEKGIS